MEWIVGVDGGGSKTAFSCRELKTGRIVKYVDRSLCPNDNGVRGYIEVLQRALKSMGIAVEDVAAACIGVPCFGEYAQLDLQVEESTRGLFKNGRVRCENDCYVGFAAAFALESGINIVSGTGAIAYGEDVHGGSARSNGWDSDFSDEGSGTWLGRRLFSVFAKQSDGRLPKSALYGLLKEKLSISDDFKIINFYREHCSDSRTKLAAMQSVLLEAAGMGDLTAAALYVDAAQELAQSVAAVYRALSFEGTVRVSCSGGVFGAGELIRRPFEEKLKLQIKDVQICAPMMKPEDGALLVAEKLL